MSSASAVIVPESRISSSLAASTRSGVSGLSTLSTLAQTARALATESCCETMIEARLEKPLSRRRNGGMPVRAMTRSQTGSSAARATMPSSRSAVLEIVVMQVRFVADDRSSACQEAGLGEKSREP
jgi:hypothetical protein